MQTSQTQYGEFASEPGKKPMKRPVTHPKKINKSTTDFQIRSLSLSVCGDLWKRKRHRKIHTKVNKITVLIVLKKRNKSWVLTYNGLVSQRANKRVNRVLALFFLSIQKNPFQRLDGIKPNPKTLQIPPLSFTFFPTASSLFFFFSFFFHTHKFLSPNPFLLLFFFVRSKPFQCFFSLD